MIIRLARYILSVTLLLTVLIPQASGQTALEVASTSFNGVIHDNLSNKERQGSGFTPLVLKFYPASNLFRDDAVGLNFEHIFNGAKKQNDISMIPCPVDAATERLRKKPASAGAIQTVLPVTRANTSTSAPAAVSPGNSRETSGESDFISQPPDQFDQYRTVEG